MFSQAFVCSTLVGGTCNASLDRSHGLMGGGHHPLVRPGHPPPWSDLVTSPQGQRSTTPQEGKVIDPPPRKERSLIPPPPPGRKRSLTSPREGKVIDLPPTPRKERSLTPPPSRIHTGTTVNGRAVRILLECILVQMIR